MTPSDISTVLDYRMVVVMEVWTPVPITLNEKGCLNWYCV